MLGYTVNLVKLANARDKNGLRNLDNPRVLEEVRTFGNAGEVAMVDSLRKLDNLRASACFAKYVKVGEVGWEERLRGLGS